MWVLLFLFTVSVPCTVQALKPFDPWLIDDGACRSSMDSCTFHLRASNAMTMFYKQLFRVVSTDNGILHKYDNPNETFNVENILTGDGYPKLVSTKYSLEENNILYSQGVCV
jgi:hypothetical protein